MNKYAEHKIAYKGLSEGIHLFDFALGDEFFKDNGSEEIQGGNVKVKLTIDKQSRMMVLDFEIKGKIVVDCDRCGFPLEIKVNETQKLIAKYTDDGSDSEEIIILEDKEALLDVGPLMYEFVIISLPMRKTHSTGKCDKEQLERLEKLSQKTNSDSPWEALKGLKLEDN